MRRGPLWRSVCPQKVVRFGCRSPPYKRGFRSKQDDLFNFFQLKSFTCVCFAPRRPPVAGFAAEIGRRACTFAQGGTGLTPSGSSGCTKDSGSQRNLFRASQGRWEAKSTTTRVEVSHDRAVSLRKHALPPPSRRIQGKDWF